jgi:hypothetical protein
MKKKAARKAKKSPEDILHEKLDDVAHVLEDLYILQALSMGIERADIRSVLGVHTTRISRVNKGVKLARKKAAKQKE